MSQVSHVRPIEKTGATPQTDAAPTANPTRIFQTINAFQQTGALRAAIELDVFTAIAEGLKTAPEIAECVHAAERGVRILCDYMALLGLLTKDEGRYSLAEDAAIFLDRRSPAYMGTMVRFLNAPEILDAYRDLTPAVRKGGTTMSGKGSVDPEDPLWVEFARSMAPMMYMPARRIAELLSTDAGQRIKVLDIAAGHGLFGIAIAKGNPQAQIVALDWKPVLEVALENARKEGVDARYSTLPGSAFEAEFGHGYDLVLLTNFLHHFNPHTCEGLLRKAHAALLPGGRVVLLEFVPNEDRVTPPESAFFSLIMLGTTPDGDAYTFAEFRQMLAHAGFASVDLVCLEQMPESVIIATK